MAETRQFTEDNASEILYNGCLYNTKTEKSELLYETIYETIVSADIYYACICKEIVIQELNTGKLFTAVLKEGVNNKFDKYNAEQIRAEYYLKIINKKLVNLILEKL